MSFHKAIKHGKEKRKPFYGKHNPKNVSSSCQNHGDCPICTGNRIRKEVERIKSLTQMSDLEIAIWLSNEWGTDTITIQEWLEKIERKSKKNHD